MTTNFDQLWAMLNQEPMICPDLRFCPMYVASDSIPEFKSRKPGVLGVTFFVLQDSIRCGPDRVRLGVNPSEQQRIADLLDCSMPTPRLLDLRHRHAVELGAFFEPVFRVDGEVAANADPVRYSQAVDAKVLELFEGFAVRPGWLAGPYDGVGKSWCLTNKITFQQQAWNYGWHSFQPWVSHYATLPLKSKVAQSLGGKHNLWHKDPPQGTFGLVAQECLIHHDDLLTTLSRVERLLRDTVLCPFVSHEGPLQFTRLPSVDPVEPLLHIPRPGVESLVSYAFQAAARGAL